MAGGEDTRAQKKPSTLNGSRVVSTCYSVPSELTAFSDMQSENKSYV